MNTFSDLKNGDIIVFSPTTAQVILMWDEYNASPERLFPGEILTIIDKDDGFMQPIGYGDAGSKVLYKGQIFEIISDCFDSNFKILGDK